MKDSMVYKYETTRQCICGYVYIAEKALWKLGHSICPKCNVSAAYPGGKIIKIQEK